MNLQELKQKALKLKQKALDTGKNALDYSTMKLADSKLTLKTKESLEDFIKKSETTVGKDSTTGIEKSYTHRVLVLFADTKSDFFTSLLYVLPVLSAKTFSQNMAFRIADIDMKGIDTKSYGLQEGKPSLLVFENMKCIKTLTGEENIQKVVKSLSLDINTTIDTL